MATDIFGLSRSVSKQVDLTIEQYSGSARDGELIIDLNPGPGQYRLYVGRENGSISSASTGVSSIDIVSNSFTVIGSPVTSSGIISIDIPSRIITTTSTARAVLFSAVVLEPTGYEFLVKAVNTSTGQINLQRLTVVSSNNDCNFSRFGQVELGMTLGTPDATMQGAILELGITPSIAIPIIWTLQYQRI